MKVLVLMEGCYSDRHIVGMFAEEERRTAEDAARLIGGDVEEWEVGKLKLVDPMPMRYPLITARPENGQLIIEVQKK